MDLKFSLTASILLGETKQVHSQTKQQFFNIKKSSRRIKGSIISEKETSQKSQTQQNNKDKSFQFIKKLENLDVKQLHYSLAQTEQPQVILQFKTKQPKKKKITSKIYYNVEETSISSQKQRQKLLQEESSKTVNELNNSISFQRQNKLQKSNINSLSHSQNLEISKQKITFIEPKKIISKTVTSLFNHKIPLSYQKQVDELSIKDFHLMKMLGEGTYSKVYQTIHKKTGFLCALKVLQKKQMKQLNVLQNAIRQIKILSCLSWHQNINTLYGAFSDQNCIYLILELCTDGDVHKKIKKLRTPITPSILYQQQKKFKQHKQIIETVHILKQICLALKQLHENSIIHRDIKPQNILVTMGNNIKLSDFGWSVYNPKTNLRKTLCGTPLYLAPEFITTCRYNDSVDIWSLGVMAYELFSHAFPFKIQSVNDLIKIAQQQIDFEKVKNETARDFCKKALVKDRHYRADIWQLLEHQIFSKYPYQQ